MTSWWDGQDAQCVGARQLSGVLGLGNSTDGCYQGCFLCCVGSREDREQSVEVICS